MAEDFGLVGGDGVDVDFGEAGTLDDPILCRCVSGLLVEDVVVRGDVAGRLRRI